MDEPSTTKQFFSSLLGVPDYAFKLLVLQDGDSVQAFSRATDDSVPYPTADVESFTRSAHRGLALQLGGGSHACLPARHTDGTKAAPDRCGQTCVV